MNYRDIEQEDVFVKIPEFYYKREIVKKYKWKYRKKGKKYKKFRGKLVEAYELVTISKEKKSGYSKSEAFSVGRYTI